MLRDDEQAPRTELGRKLAAIRAQAIAGGMELQTVEQICASLRDDSEDKLGNEDWAMGIARKAHFAQVTLHVRDRVIERVNVNLTLKPGESWPE